MQRNTVMYFAKNLGTVVGIVLIWRAIWHLLNEIDIVFFGGNPYWSIGGGLVLGFLMLYLPDHDLKEIEKM